MNNNTSLILPTMSRKPVLYRDAKTVLTLDSPKFQEKLLCDGLVFSAGDACAYSCTFCYVGPAMWKIDSRLINQYNESHGTSLGFQEVVIRRRDPLSLLRRQLLDAKGSPRYADPADTRVVYSSTLVDVAGNMELLRETASLCNLLLEHTPWQIRLLSKSGLLHKLIADLLIPEKHHHRLIFGFSTGTLDDSVAAAIETGTALVSKRLKSLYWLQDRGLRTFGMICPSLPQQDYDRFSSEICDAIRIRRCEHVWAEVINLRGRSLISTLTALRQHGLTDEADRVAAVSGSGSSQPWEDYARATFAAHAAHIPQDKLRFLQYVNAGTVPYWSGRRRNGAVLLGIAAEKLESSKALCQTAPRP